MSSTALLAGPADFPVQWSDPSDERMFWFQDNLHCPVVLTPMNATLFQTAFGEGSSRAIARLSMPIAGLRTAVHNGYVYLGPVPVLDEPEALQHRFTEMQRIMQAIGPSLLQDWRETFEPRVMGMADRILDYDYDGSSTRQVAGFATSFYTNLVEAWDIHMRINIPAMNAVFGLETFLLETLGDEAVAQSRQLLQGFENKTIEMGRELWALSRWVRSVDGLQEAVVATRIRGGRVEVDHARVAEFSERLQAFLDVYGWRTDIFLEFGHPSWQEDPSTPLIQLKNYLRKEDAEDPFAAHRQQAEDRDRLTSELQAGLPEHLWPQFEGMLQMAQQYIPIAEDHNFTIDQKFTVVVRRGLQQLGRKLVQDGALADAGDVFYLTFDDVRAVAAGNDLSALRAQVRERRQQFIRQGKVTPPPVLGTPPPTDMPPDPLVTKFFGFGAQVSDDPKVVTGYPASSGVVAGIAKVVKTLDEAGKLESGDIMVCRMTMPAWTPLFGSVSAVVSDAGGPLSHCAIVAREYKIPCVAGTQVGTALITDGMRLLVDGSAGRVQILG